MPSGVEAQAVVDPVPMTARRKYTWEEQVRWLERWRTCGQSTTQFAKRHGLNISTLYRWREEASAGNKASARSAPPFTEIRVRKAAPVVDAGVIEVVLSEDRRVRVVGKVEREQLRMVLEVLGAC